MQLQTKKPAKLQVDLVPLINIIFLLLIFFMLTGTVEKLDILEVDLPASENGKNKLSKPAVLYMATGNRLAINDDLVNEEDLPTILSTLVINNPSQEVTIKADGTIKASKLIKVMNLMEKLQIKNVTLLTRKDG